MTVVCVLAHPDDEMRCLGTLLRLRERGRRFAFVTVSGGDKGLPFGEATPEETVALRAGEMQQVAAAFDAEHVSLGREDGFVEDDTALRRELVGTLRRLGAETIFTHWTTDYNADHEVTARATVAAALLVNLPSFEPQVPALAHPPRIWHVNPGDGYGFEGTHFVEHHAAHAAEKAALVRLHDSQMAVMRELRGDDYADEMAALDRQVGARLLAGPTEAFRPCLSERRIPWPDDLPGRLDGGRP
jgi:LmbE family N-acetylglucosaminyl deacetylase